MVTVERVGSHGKGVWVGVSMLIEVNLAGYILCEGYIVSGTITVHIITLL